MTNNYGIPEWLEKKIRGRDTVCVYCHVKLKTYPHSKGTPGDKATIEHIDNDGPPEEDNLAMCCASCNSSKGTKKLSDWLSTSYCKQKNISAETVASIIQQYIKRGR